MEGYRVDVVLGFFGFGLQFQPAFAAQAPARRMKAVYGVARMGFAFTDGDITHIHAHIIPLYAHDDLISRRYLEEEIVTYGDLPCPSHQEAMGAVAMVKPAF